MANGGAITLQDLCLLTWLVLRPWAGPLDLGPCSSELLRSMAWMCNNYTFDEFLDDEILGRICMEVAIVESTSLGLIY